MKELTVKKLKDIPHNTPFICANGYFKDNEGRSNVFQKNKFQPLREGTEGSKKFFNVRLYKGSGFVATDLSMDEDMKVIMIKL